MTDTGRFPDKTTVTKSHVFFYGGPFSQWYPSKFKARINGRLIEFGCAEQWMMANKAALFKDREAYSRIMRTDSPREQKAAGRDVKPYNEATWAGVRYDLVVDGNLAKFSQNENMKAWMLDVGPGHHFVEASPTDRIWGIGLSIEEAPKVEPTEWPGQNLLGKALDETCAWLMMGKAERTKR